MDPESRSPKREREAPEWHHCRDEAVDIAHHMTAGITESLQHQLESLHSKFLTSSDSILAQISETGSQLEQLERRIDEMVKEAGNYRVSLASKRSSKSQVTAQEVNDSCKQ
uniref:Uncharacterized protein n=1 Tax=Physcomitrium patens TaxID=3218 RepID=A9SEZ3_PHYPA|nr:hypothetical protein PHYPA_007073 [Physcomitrium patens]